MSPTARTVFRAVVLSLAAMVLVVLGVGLLLADSWQVQTVRTIPAPPERVEALVTDLSTWPRWSAWDPSLGPQTQRAVEGAPGVGQRIVWSGPHRRWRLEVTARTGDSLHYTFAPVADAAAAPNGATSGGTVQWVADGAGTRVTWTDRGTWDNLALRWFGWFGAIQDRAQQMQSSSLTGLAQQLEANAPK